MKPLQFISEFEALIVEYIDHCASVEPKYHQRNAICVTVCRDCGVKEAAAPTAKAVINAISRAFGATIPVVPDNTSRSDADDQIRLLLGQEHPVVAVDGTRSWPDKALGAAAGTVRTPGLLILLLPNGLYWSKKASPYEQHLKRSLSRHFTAHPTIPQLWSILPLDQTLSSAALPKPNTWQTEQRKVLDKILNRCSSDRTTVDVLLTRRGRGKSALIGLAINQLNRSASSKKNPTLTASHSSQVVNVQKHAAANLVKFTALDEALQQRGDILFVDEAGSVPLPVLLDLTQRFKHTVLAGTVDGYEGAGRALAVRLAQSLAPLNVKVIDNRTHFHQLDLPIRWPENDRVERMVSEVLLLEQAEQVQQSVLSHSDNGQEFTKHAEHCQVFSEQLLDDASLLDSVFGLLMLAHYQTSSKDLQHLLNLKGLSLFIQTCNNVLSGACLVAHEGALCDDTIAGIKQGKRRPSHQRLPMLLHRQCADDSLLRARHWRIIRIAIQPELQQRGLGTQLLAYVKQAALTAPPNVAPNFIGASFGGTALALQFWQQAKYRPFHWGYRLNPRSGQRAVAVAQCVNDSRDDIIGNTNNACQSLDNARAQFIDTVQTIKQLNDMQLDWFAVLYGSSPLDKQLLESMLKQQPLKMNPVNDPQRIKLWQQGNLALHDIWGSLARRVGGVQAMARWGFPDVTNASKLTKQIQNRVLDL